MALVTLWGKPLARDLDHKITVGQTVTQQVHTTQAVPQQPETAPADPAEKQSKTPRTTAPKISKPRVNKTEIRANSPTVQSCPNGNCIGGDNYGEAIVNNYAPPRRTLAKAQADKLISLLKPVCPFDVAVRGFPGSEESIAYADQIQSAIHAAGCNIVRPRFLIDEHMSYGVWVALHDRDVPKGAYALLSALRESGIKCGPTVVPVIESGTIYVMVQPPEPANLATSAR